MTWVKTQGVFTNKPWHKLWLVSKSGSESRCRSARWWLAPRLSSEYHNRTDICFTNTRNYCHRNKIYVLTSLLKQIYLQSAECARTYCTVNTVCHSCYHHSEFTSETHLWTAMWRLLWVRDDVTIVAIDFEWKNVTQTKQRRDMRLTSWLTSRLNRVSMISFVNTTWLGPGPSLKWNSVRVPAKSWVKSQVKAVSVYGPWALCYYCNLTQAF